MKFEELKARFKITGFALCLMLLTIPWAAAQNFVVRKIEVVGLQRVQRDTVLDYLPIKIGQRFSSLKSKAMINALYQTGFFDDISLSRRGGKLIVHVVERPIISRIRISGNDNMPEEKLRAGLKIAGVTEGRVYNQSVLDMVKKELEQQYQHMGHYAAQVDISLVKESRGRVALDINIAEGSVLSIKEINIVGNKAFSSDVLRKQFKLTKTGLFTFFTKNDEYNKMQLDADLSKLSQFYMDKGFVEFRVVSHDVRIGNEKNYVYITVKVNEGVRYHFGKTEVVAQHYGGDEANLQSLNTIVEGSVFSRTQLLDIQKAINKQLADQGYAFPTINVLTHVDEKKKQVSLRFEVNPGQRVYVRRILFHGNIKTEDQVLRRELRQEEGSRFSLSQVEESKRRLSNLGYVGKVQVTPQPVPGHPHEVDLDYSVEDVSTPTVANFQAGYSDTDGLLYGINVSQKNFLGTGKFLSLGFQHSQYMRSYDVQYSDPYYTPEGVSRSIHLYLRKVQPGRVNVSSFSTNTVGASINYAIPVSEYSSLTFGYGYENLEINADSGAPKQVTSFIAKHGSSFNQFLLNAGWQQSNYDRAVFPTKGHRQSLGLEVAVPVGNKSLEFYRLNYNASFYQPLPQGFIFRLGTTLGYGAGYGAFGRDLPFFKNFYAGGFGSVRGFDGNSLGPRDSKGRPIGGNVKAVGSMSLILPELFGPKVRTSVFLDAGSIFANRFDISQFRLAAGAQVEWASPMGVVVDVSLAKPINARGKDDTRPFQFNIGTSF